MLIRNFKIRKYFKETAHTPTKIQKAYLYIKSSNIGVHFWSFPGLFKNIILKAPSIKLSIKIFHTYMVYS